MSDNLKSALERAVGFDATAVREAFPFKHDVNSTRKHVLYDARKVNGARFENARLAPILERLIEVVTSLEEADQMLAGTALDVKQVRDAHEHTRDALARLRALVGETRE